MMHSTRRPAAFLLSLVLSGACWSAAASMPVTQTPQSAVEELLAADRAAAAASARTTVIPGLTAMFASDVMMGAPVVGFARGVAAATEALKNNPDNLTGRLEWAPVRGGVSADGEQGFTFGYMTLHGAKGAVPLKYLAYWVKREGRWQVAGYKRRPRPAGDVSTAILAPAVPGQLVPVTADPAILARHSASLTAAEQAFSDEAQRIGLGAAFTKYGSSDAMNMGGPTDAAFVIGNDAIGRNIGADGPADSSPVSWSADSVIVASSGDLGITFGLIRSNAKPPAQPPIPFFTIWRRANPNAPWRYVAE